MVNNYKALSKLVSHALRHEPWLYELEIDSEGWVECEKLIEVLRLQSETYKYLTYQDLEKMIQTSDKIRFELYGNKIRALYGHSIPYRLTKEKHVPPVILYHGTKPELIDLIKIEGLKPMGRHYVHLSVDKKTAVNVGLRKSKKPIIFMIEAKKAYDNGVNFYRGNDIVWLADNIPPNYLKYDDQAKK